MYSQYKIHQNTLEKVILNITLNKTEALVILEPQGKLTKKDFEAAATSINPLIKKLGKLNGIIVHVEKFPYWDSFSALISHLKFIKEHHKRVAKITDAQKWILE